MTWRWPWQKITQPVRPPKVAGTRAPNRVLNVGFERPHDYYFRFGGSNDTFSFPECTLVGFTTPIEDPNDVPSHGEAWYDRWIVLKRPDGRLVYLPRNGLMYIEESGTMPESSPTPAVAKAKPDVDGGSGEG